MSKPVVIPKPTGEYAVGTFTYTVKDAREEVMHQGGMRSVATRVYYPVLKESVAGCEKPVGLSDNMIKGFKGAFKVAPNFKKNSELNRSECYINAPKIPDKRFPLIMFNHGYLSYREGNSFLCIELASHGYVVISVAHSYEGLCTEFDDGSYVLYDKTISKKMYEPDIPGKIAMLKFLKVRGSDEELAEKFDIIQRKYCKFMIGRLPEWIKDNEAALEYAKNNLTDIIDFEKGVGVSGHSFGGNTAYALCARNPDFTCGINLDGGLFGEYNDDIQTRPFMQLSCSDNERVVTRVYLRHTKPVYKVLFNDMRHMGFADAKHMIPMKSVVGKLDPDKAHKLVSKCHLEFFDAYLKGKKDEPVFPESDVITVTKFDPDM
ncbi:MAG: hypothetical protein K6G75_02885 [Lachnospiraceae bacterium]|nr:hypothetical protein [Lachnospiraceae bacterium]